MSNLTDENIREALKMTEKYRGVRGSPGLVQAEYGGRALFSRHCGMRMIRVKVFYLGGGCAKHKKREPDEHVCAYPHCSYHYTTR